MTATNLDGVKQFYGAFSTRLLADYAHGNSRIDAAIQHAVRWVAPFAGRVLDVGCGIGHSTAEVKRRRRVETAIGVDLSAPSIAVAQGLFSEPGLTFFDHDISQSHPLLKEPFDAIVMLDVYEHIPRHLRSAVHNTLSDAMRMGSRLILAGPTPAFQDFLRTRRPDALQPVDEDVTPDDLRELAADLGGELVFYRPVKIWRPDDYFHAVIERSPLRLRSQPRVGVAWRAGSIESLDSRRKRITRTLRVRVTRGGITMPDRADPVVCVVAPAATAMPETFIRAHIERLPVSTRFLYGGWFPCLIGEDESFLFPSASRVFATCVARLAGVDTRQVQGAAFQASPPSLREYLLRRYFRSHRVSVVLAEYGPTAATLAPVCARINVPLIAHFHGFDAYEASTLERFANGYRRLFKQAAAIVVVSRHMESQLLSLGANPEQLRVIPCGVDVSIFKGSEPATAPPLFVAVGRFVDKKAPLLTLLAFAKVVERVPAARLIMIGDGPLLEAARQTVAALRISHAVELPGARSHAYVADVMRKARGFVQHSVQTGYGDMEGTPVALLEAGASSLPAVVTRHGGMTEVVLDGVTGFLVDEGDIPAMAAGMLRLTEQPELAAALGRAARDRVQAEFSIERSINSLSQVINHAVIGTSRTAVSAASHIHADD